MNAFKPILYVKATCPHCFKLRLFLLEAGVADRFDVQSFTPGDAAEAPIRAELAPHFDKVTFPTAQVEPGRYVRDSDALVDHYAAVFGVDPATLPLFTAYAGSILPRYQAARRENKALKGG